ncbi:MAG: type III pantothenate kinase [Chromatiaceae bacterium]|nr:type III pantothenate kinase [Chromatiaceae bacterium]
MMLLLDIGNTNLRWTLAEEGALGEVRVLRHGGAMPLDLLAEWESLEAPDRVVASNVAGEAMAMALARVTRACWGLTPTFVATQAEWRGLRVAYAEPARFGVDRWLALIAAHAESRRATLILDAGSAATFDLLLGDGRHLGGLILPGVEMMRASLLRGTQIPRIEYEPTDVVWARDTATAVAAGSLSAIASLASRLYDRLAVEVGEPPRFILTGGDAERLHPYLDRPSECIPDLVLKGLLAYVSAADHA